jgi:hypothetical protein
VSEKVFAALANMWLVPPHATLANLNVTTDGLTTRYIIRLKVAFNLVAVICFFNMASVKV